MLAQTALVESSGADLARATAPDHVILGGVLTAAVVTIGRAVKGDRRLRTWALVALVLSTRLITPLREALDGVTVEWATGPGFSGSVRPLFHPAMLLTVAFGLVIDADCDGNHCRTPRRGTDELAVKASPGPTETVEPGRSERPRSGCGGVA